MWADVLGEIAAAEVCVVGPDGRPLVFVGVVIGDCARKEAGVVLLAFP